VYVSKQLAQYFCCDQPSDDLVRTMAATWRKSDGDIAQVLEVLFASHEFTSSLGKKFKDPVHYAVSAVRVTYGNQVIVSAQPMLNWLNRMGEPLYGRQTPDGYALTEAAWAGPGQMATRFEVARAIGASSAGLFKTDGPAPVEQPAFPQLANGVYYGGRRAALSRGTDAALLQATSQQEWNMVFLSSPEMMDR